MAEHAAPPPRHELYIYYRAPEAHASTVAEAVQRMQRELIAAHPGLTARLLRRPELTADQHTWMETYALPEGGDAEVVRALAAAIDRAAEVLQPLLAGPRHTEHFIACAS